MARCQLVVWLALIHLCVSYPYGGFEQYQDPRLIPQPPVASQGYYQNPYSQYNNNPFPVARNYVAQREYGYNNGYPEENAPNDSDNFLEEDMQTLTEQTSTGGTPTASTGGASAAQVITPATAATGGTGQGTGANSNMDALDIQLAAALEAVKADMISKGKQVLEEKQWTDDVKSVIAEYQTKISNVYADIASLKVDMGNLYRKKQQILNAQIQKSLTSKLADSKSDLDTVTSALEKVTNTQQEFEQSKSDIQTTINQIYMQLAELQGATGGSSGSASGSGTGGGGGGSAATPAAGAASSSDSSDSSSDVSDSDIVDQKADISSKIDTIKSIVDALNANRRRR